MSAEPAWNTGSESDAVSTADVEPQVRDDGEATSNAEFQTLEYWDRRYVAKAAQGEETFEWFKGYAEIKNVLDELISDKNARILMLGCGNSGLSADMTADGYKNITNLDFSTVVISQMKERHPDQDWRVMDVRKLREHSDELGGSGSWDVIIDKGTLDALMAEKGSVWSPSETVLENVAAEVEGVLDLLKPGTGRFLYLTFGQAARILRTFTVQGAQADDDPSAEATGGVIGGATKTPDQLEQERKLHQYDSRKTRKVIKKIPPQVIAQAKGRVDTVAASVPKAAAAPVPATTPASLQQRHSPRSTPSAHSSPTHLANMPFTGSDICKIIFAVILPPLGVFLERGCGADFWINVLLTILGYIPGIVHALYIIL
ncbi:hypothetical protein OC846_002898, partial [Tilletia horrida]